MPDLSIRGYKLNNKLKQKLGKLLLNYKLETELDRKLLTGLFGGVRSKKVPANL